MAFDLMANFTPPWRQHFVCIYKDAHVSVRCANSNEAREKALPLFRQHFRQKQIHKAKVHVFHAQAIA